MEGCIRRQTVQILNSAIRSATSSLPLCTLSLSKEAGDYVVMQGSVACRLSLYGNAFS